MIPDRVSETFYPDRKGGGTTDAGEIIMVRYWTSVYFDRAMFRNNPIFAMNLAVAIDDHITQAFNDYGCSLELCELRLIERETTPDTIAVYLELYEDDDDADLCIHGYEHNYEGGYLESTSVDDRTIRECWKAENSVEWEIANMMDVQSVHAEVDIESLDDDDDYDEANRYDHYDDCDDYW